MFVPTEHVLKHSSMSLLRNQYCKRDFLRFLLSLRHRPDKIWIPGPLRTIQCRQGTEILIKLAQRVQIKITTNSVAMFGYKIFGAPQHGGSEPRPLALINNKFSRSFQSTNLLRLTSLSRPSSFPYFSRKPNSTEEEESNTGAEGANIVWPRCRQESWVSVMSRRNDCNRRGAMQRCPANIVDEQVVKQSIMMSLTLYVCSWSEIWIHRAYQAHGT